jgi:hypothetical protein
MKIPGGSLDNGTASWSHAVMQFDGNESHVLDPRAGLKHFYFGTFNVHRPGMHCCGRGESQPQRYEVPRD